MEKSQERLYKRWLRHNGLPDSFPNPNDNIHLNGIYKHLNFDEDVNRVIRKANQPIKQLAVLLPAGQGTTTFATKVIAANVSNIASSNLINYINAGAEEEIFYCQETFERKISKKVLQSLINTFTPEYLNSLGNGSSVLLNDLFSMLEVRDLDAYRDLEPYEDLNESVDSANGIESLYQRFANGQLAVKNLTQLLTWVKTKADSTVISLIDISSSLDSDEIDEIAAKLKCHSDQLNDGEPLAPFAYKMALFCTPEQFRNINSVWNVNFDTLKIKHYYSQFELWQILSRHYSPKIEGDTIAQITDIMDQEFMEFASTSREILPLKEIYARLKKLIIMSLSELEDKKSMPRKLKCPKLINPSQPL